MQWDKFAPFFHESWHSKIKKWVESEDCDKLYTFLKSESKRGVQIAPLSNLTYRAFLETPLNEVKVVLLSWCPYHSFYNGVAAADGLAFSCSVTGKLQPSLITFYEGIENDISNGLNLEYVKYPDLSYLAHQGVLLMNCSLTVAKGKAGSHDEIWHGFTKFILEECLAYTGIPIVFIGKDAQKFERYVSPLTHGYIFSIEHPSFAARNNQLWNTKGVFTKINRIIREANGPEFEIDWLNTKPPF